MRYVLLALDEKDECSIVDTIVFDGYAFGDRQLEGVMFSATATETGIDIAVVSNNSYVDRLNITKIKKEALAYLLSTDIVAGNDCDWLIYDTTIPFGEQKAGYEKVPFAIEHLVNNG